MKMNTEGLEELVFTNIHFNMKVKLETDNEHKRKKAKRVYEMAQKIRPIRQSWGENVPISFELNFQKTTSRTNTKMTARWLCPLADTCALGLVCGRVSSNQPDSKDYDLF